MSDEPTWTIEHFDAYLICLIGFFQQLGVSLDELKVSIIRFAETQELWDYFYRQADIVDRAISMMDRAESRKVRQIKWLSRGEDRFKGHPSSKVYYEVLEKN